MNKEINARQLKTIQNFWNWFQDNEQNIYNAIILGINPNEVMEYFDINLGYVSKKIECFFIKNPSGSQKNQMIFSAYGYRKIFPKIIALGDAAPKLEYFIAQTFIKPLTSENLNQLPEDFHDIIKQIVIKLENYDIYKKQVKITLYLPEKYEFENNFKAYNLAELALLFTLGEVKFNNHIDDFEVKPFTNNEKGLLSLTELTEFIDYLSKTNLNKKLKVLLGYGKP